MVSTLTAYFLISGRKGSEKMTVEGLTGILELLCLLFSRKIADVHFSGIIWET